MEEPPTGLGVCRFYLLLRKRRHEVLEKHLAQLSCLWRWGLCLPIEKLREDQTPMNDANGHTYSFDQCAGRTVRAYLDVMTRALRLNAQ